MWYCTSCGAQNQDEGAFCDQCGAPRQLLSGKPAGKKKGGKTLLLIGGIVLGLALIGLGLWMLLGKSSPTLYRTAWFRSSRLENGSRYETVVSESWYYYNDDGTGRVENEDHVVTQTFVLNKKGQIASAVFLDSYGIENYREEYEYDRFGNRSRLSRYKNGVLTYLAETEYDEERTALHSIQRQYEDGREVYRSELDFPEKTQGTLRVFKNGFLDSESRAERQYTDGKLTYQQYYSSDGQAGTWMKFVRDDDNNTLRQEVHSASGVVTIYAYRYEKIG